MIHIQWHGVNQFLASRNIQGRFKQTGLRYSSRQFLSLRYGWGRCGSPHHQGAGPQIISMCLIMRCTPNSALVDRVDFATSQSLSSRSVTDLSALAPAKRAGAQRLCAMALPGSIRDRRRLPVIEVERKNLRSSLRDPCRHVDSGAGRAGRAPNPDRGLAISRLPWRRPTSCCRRR